MCNDGPQHLAPEVGELQSSITVHLGTETEFPAGSGQLYRIVRGLLAADLELSGDPTLASRQLITVFCTHLDHMSEDQRVTQVTHILSEMEKLGPARPHMLLGDLNALRRADYGEREWEEILEKASKSGWSAPRDAECLDLLENRGFLLGVWEVCGYRASSPSAWYAPRGRCTDPRQE